MRLVDSGTMDAGVLARLECAAVRRVGTIEREEALKLPAESRLRAHMLRDATRLLVAADCRQRGGTLNDPPGPRVAQPPPEDGAA